MYFDVHGTKKAGIRHFLHGGVKMPVTCRHYIAFLREKSICEWAEEAHQTKM